MKRWIAILAVLVSFAVPSAVWATGTVTMTEYTIGSVKMVKFAWTSDASGDATATTTCTYTGQLLWYAEVPDTGLSAPTDQYDVGLTDANALDLLMGQGANIPNLTGKYVVMYPYGTGASGKGLGVVCQSKISLTVANAGNAKSGVTYVFIR